MFTQEVLFTPAVATQLLSRNNLNRPVNADRVASYARDIQSGNWKRTGDTIKISIQGRVLDGQHRLHAVVMAGASVYMLCVYDVDESVMDFIDTGAPRTGRDVLAMAGVKNASTVNAALKQIVYFERGIFNGTSGSGGQASVRRVSNHELKEAMQRHPGITETVDAYYNLYNRNSTKSVGLLLTPSLGVFLFYITSKQHPEKASEFFLGLSGKINVDVGSPVFLLRERLIQNKLANSKLPARSIAALTVKAWLAFRDGKRPSRLRYDIDEKFPILAQ